MNKTTSAWIAAVALALSGGAYAQTSGGMSGSMGGSNSSSPNGMTAPATNQMNDSSGYGMPGATNSDAGMGAQGPNLAPQKGANTTSVAPTSGPKSNNSLATPSVLSPVDQQ